MIPFTETLNEQKNVVRIVLRPADTIEWPAVAKHLRDKLAEGILNVELDLRRLSRIDSLGLGIIVGMNVTASHHGGSFRLLVERGTAIHNLMILTKMHLLLTIVETDK